MKKEIPGTPIMFRQCANSNMDSTFSSKVISGIKGAQLGKVVGFLVFLVLFKAGMDYATEMSLFWIAQYASEGDFDSILKCLIFNTIIDACYELISYSIAYIQSKHVMVKLSRHLYNKYFTFIFSLSLSVLQQRKSAEDFTSINDGIGSITGTIGYGNDVIQNSLRLVTASAVSISLMGIYCLPGIVSSIILFCIGIKIMKDNYLKCKEIKKETNPITTMLTYISESIWCARINGLGKRLLPDIVKNSLMKFKKEMNQYIFIEKKYTILCIISSIMINLNTIYFVYTLDKKYYYLIIPCFNNFRRLNGNIWGLFHRIGSLTQTASGIASLDEIIIECKDDIDTTIRIPLDIDNPRETLSNIIGIEIPSTCKKIVLKATSGGGKTTFMKKTANAIVNTYGDRHIYYMDQKMEFIKSSGMTLFDFLTMKIVKKRYISTYETDIINIIRIFGKDMNLSDDIMKLNSKTSDMSPSGGEENRLCVIQILLPIYLDIKINGSAKPYLFIDEATAGLDPATFTMITGLLEELLSNIDIIMMIIDHHMDNILDKLNEIKEMIPKQIMPQFERIIESCTKIHNGSDNVLYPRVHKKGPISIIKLDEINDKSTDYIERVIDWFIGGKDDDDKPKDKKTGPPDVWITV